jgi:hypothetical protein
VAEFSEIGGTTKCCGLINFPLGKASDGAVQRVSGGTRGRTYPEVGGRGHVGVVEVEVEVGNCYRERRTRESATDPSFIKRWSQVSVIRSVSTATLLVQDMDM